MATKTILIPTDFCVASLNTLKLALASYIDQPTRVVLIYAEYPDNSITELLFYSAENRIKALVTNEFKEALEIIKNRFEGKLLDISIELLTMNTNGYLNNYVDANKINEIYLPKTYQLKPAKNGFNPLPILKKAKVPVTEIDWGTDYKQSEQEQLIALFI